MITIIAEAGVNHNGSIETAKKLIDAAAYAKADYVKFQTFKTENLVCLNAPKAEYQKKTTKELSQFEMIKKLELDRKAHEELIQYCKLKGIKFLSTAFDLDSIKQLKDLGVKLWKIPSGEITNLPYLEMIGSFKDKVIMSTGMADMNEIGAAFKIIHEAGTSKKNITILHCNTEYPTPYKDVNLNAMKTIQQEFKTKIGYSDHTLGIEIPIAAAALGAEVLEKHFTLDKKMEGPDHAASLEPKELELMVKAIRNIEKAMGNGEKKPSESERKNIDIARKSIVAKYKIRKNDIFTEQNLSVKRPGTGISPMMWKKLIGKKSPKNFDTDDFITYEF